MFLKRYMKSNAGPRLGILSVVAAAALLVACADEVTSQEPSRPQSPPPVSSSGEEAIAVLDGTPITVSDLEEFVGDQLAQLEFQYGSTRFQLLDTGLDQAIRQRLLAAEAETRGLSVDELIEAEVGEVAISDAQIESWYQANQQRLQGRPLEQLRPAIRDFLGEQQREETLTALTDRLLEERELDIYLEPYRADVETAGHPTWGDENAPVTMVEFSDFECPYCRGFAATVDQVKDEYAGRVKLVYRQFPLDQLHPNARKAAEASLCANDQGKFWELHDLMFEEQSSLGVPSLKDKAQRLGLDAAEFDECLDSGRYADQVQSDLEAGQRVGIDGTPAVFINGRRVEGGAVPFETLAELIEDELARAGR